MRNQSNPMSQISQENTIGIKMQKLASGDHFPIANSDDGYGMISKYTKFPTEGDYIVVVRGGVLGFVQAPSGPLQLLNNSLGWTSTQDCEE
jgi:hypothetical protein